MMNPPPNVDTKLLSCSIAPAGSFRGSTSPRITKSYLSKSSFSSGKPERYGECPPEFSALTPGSASNSQQWYSTRRSRNSMACRYLNSHRGACSICRTLIRPSTTRRCFGGLVLLSLTISSARGVMDASSEKSPTRAGVSFRGMICSPSWSNETSFSSTRTPSIVRTSIPRPPRNPCEPMRTVTGNWSFTNATSGPRIVDTTMSLGAVMPTP